MNKLYATQILKAFGNPAFKVGKDKTVTFARQTQNDITVIEGLSDDDLVKEWKSLVWINYVYGQVSLNELQRIELLELEMMEREFPQEKFLKWLDEERNKFENEMSEN